MSVERERQRNKIRQSSSPHSRLGVPASFSARLSSYKRKKAHVSICGQSP